MCYISIKFIFSNTGSQEKHTAVEKYLDDRLNDMGTKSFSSISYTNKMR